MNTQYRCKNDRRRQLVRDGVQGQPQLNGIDYLEMSSDQQTLVVHFIHDLPGSGENAIPANGNVLTLENLIITGGTRIQEIAIASVSSFSNILLLRVSAVGDFSTYTLRLVTSSTEPSPPSGFDPQLSQVDFSFQIEELSEFDCEAPKALVDPPLPPPAIDYLAKDFASFRQLMLDRLAVTMPQWKERSPADVMIMLVELFAHSADYLSYYQDAVSTEAYLGTARRRVSIRRHARLLDYLMHDGCNARVWIVVQLKDDQISLELPAGTQFLTKIETLGTQLSDAKEIETALNAETEVFESLHALTLYFCMNQISFYTWGDEQCILPKGSTQATLDDPTGQLQKWLAIGKVLVFEEVKGATSGLIEDADLSRRHVVRLTQIEAKQDPLYGRSVIDVIWSAEDALPFDLTLSIVIQGQCLSDISLVRGNVLLADHGLTVPDFTFKQTIQPEIQKAIANRSIEQRDDLVNRNDTLMDEQKANRVPDFNNRYRPRLKQGSLTQQGYVRDRQNQWIPFDPKASANAAMQWELRNARPAIKLEELSDRMIPWRWQRDLLISDRFARDFVVETEDNGRAYLRFGDGTLGRLPESGSFFQVSYRIGNGGQGNIGAEAIAHVIARSIDLAGIDQVRNPLPAQGGTEPESIEQVRLYAPQAFRDLQRAVTEADYATIAERYPGVRKALATRRWTGSWYTMFITVDREGGLPVDSSFKQGLSIFLESSRLAGQDIEIDNPRFISLDIALTVQVEPSFFQSVVKKVLLEAFSNTVLPNSKLGFFHPDNFTFGQPLYLSQVIAAAVQIEGVRSAKVNRFQRWGQAPRGELEIGQIAFEQLEIARLDNNPNIPENGRITFSLEGGL